jgi:uncharacterized protein with HEPN domain
MSRDELSVLDYLSHILQSIERIERYVQDTSEVAFLQSSLLQDAVVRNFEIIGEASKNLVKHFPEFAGKHPDLPLAFAYKMRNALAHGYMQIDLETVWNTIQNDLPDLYIRVKSCVQELRE